MTISSAGDVPGGAPAGDAAGARSRAVPALAESSPSPALTVAAVARRLGIAPSTLRTWDRRYGLGPSAHVAGAHRRYTPGDLARLVVMRRLTLSGVPPADAAVMARSGPEVTSPGTGPAGGGRPGGGRVMALPGASARARGLARAAMGLDSAECRGLLGSALGDLGVVGTWEQLAIPLLTAMGQRWRATGEGVDVEHLFSEVLLCVLRGVATSVQQLADDRPVIMCCVPEDLHTLPLHALAAAAAERGIGTRMLGAGMPAEDLASATRRSGPAGIVLHAQLPVTDVGVLTLLRRLRPAPRLIVTGPGWRRAELPGFVQAAPTLPVALDEVQRSVHLG